MRQSDTSHIDEVRARKQRRLEALELQEAALGLDVSPHIRTEIDDLRKELTSSEAVTNSPVSREMLDAFQSYGQLRALIATTMSLVADIQEIKGDVKADRLERVARQHRVDLLFVALFFSVGFLAVIVLAV